MNEQSNNAEIRLQLLQLQQLKLPALMENGNCYSIASRLSTVRFLCAVAWLTASRNSWRETGKTQTVSHPRKTPAIRKFIVG